MRFRRAVTLLALLSLTGSTCRNRSSEGGGEPRPTPPAEAKLPGIDTTSLTARERREWSSLVTTLLAPCPEVPVSIAQCVSEGRPCRACTPAAELLLRQVRAGRPRAQAEEAFRARFDPGKVRTLVLEDSPSLGPPDAPVTLVEWADFECPACRMISPLLESFVERYPGAVRFVYKFYPLGSHPQGEPAARAAFAAHRQGKFWEMHDALFEHQGELDGPTFERLARELELDLARFRADVAAPATAERISRDKQQAESVGLEGTPMVFVNGRHVDLEQLTDPVDDLDAWIQLELRMAGRSATPRPPASQDGGDAKTTRETRAPSNRSAR